MKDFIKSPTMVFIVVALLGYLFSLNGRLDDFVVFALAIIIAKQFEK